MFNIVFPSQFARPFAARQLTRHMCEHAIDCVDGDSGEFQFVFAAFGQHKANRLKRIDDFANTSVIM